MPTKPAKVALSSDKTEAEVKSEVSSDDALTVDKSSKFLDDTADLVDSSEQDGCTHEADSTDKQETNCTSSDSARNKRGRQRKSGSKLLSLWLLSFR